MPDTSKHKVNWRGTPLSIGMLLAMVAGIVYLSSLIMQGREMIDEAATKAAKQAVSSHVQRPVNVSHPDLPKQYTPLVEFRLGVQQIRSDIKAQSQSIQQLSDQVKQINARRPTRRPTRRPRRSP